MNDEAREIQSVEPAPSGLYAARTIHGEVPNENDASTVVPALAPAETEHPFSFTGTASGYFKVWIVNLFLTIVTFGVWSAWAKVRKTRYFYGHTWVGGSNFEYHADPIKILKGRLIVALIAVLYWFFGNWKPQVALWIGLAVAIVSPWFVLRSLKFNAANSSWRGLRFRSVATLRESAMALWPVLLVPLSAFLAPDAEILEDPEGQSLFRFFVLSLLTLAPFLLAYPYLTAKTRMLQVNGLRYSSAAFQCRATLWDFYKLYLRSAVVAFGGLLVAGMLFGVISLVFVRTLPPWSGAFDFIRTLIPIVMLLCFAYPVIALWAFNRSRLINLVFNTSGTGTELRFRSSLSGLKYANTVFVCLVGIVLTCGLAIPWARIKLARFRARALSLATTQNLDDLLASATLDDGATGDAINEWFALDIGL